MEVAMDERLVGYLWTLHDDLTCIQEVLIDLERYNEMHGDFSAKKNITVFRILIISLIKKVKEIAYEMENSKTDEF